MAKAITLLESTRVDHRVQADELLTAILPHTGKSFRLGISGVPGVGKSTFIEALGLYLIGLGHRVAVLAVDPSSTVSGGSILGDKTRMETLSVHPLAYIRPSPAGESLGGVAHRTRETMLLCEAAGFEVILVETVGVGQSETLVHGMVDFFLLLMLAGAGDELQGMKRGIMELADAIAITKADGENAAAADRARVEYSNALHLFPPTSTGWTPPVLTCSATENRGIAHLWQVITDHQNLLTENGHRHRLRQAQNLDWMRSHLRQQLEERFYQQPGIRQRLETAEQRVQAGELLPVQAVAALLSDEPFLPSQTPF